MKYVLDTNKPSVEFVHRTSKNRTADEISQYAKLLHDMDLSMRALDKQQGRDRNIMTVSEVEKYAKEKNDHDRFIFVKRDNVVLGYLVWHDSVSYKFSTYIEELYLDPKLRGMGLGRELVTLAISTIKSEYPKTSISIGVLANNLVAKSLYQSLGFDQVVHESLLMKA